MTKGSNLLQDTQIQSRKKSKKFIGQLFLETLQCPNEICLKLHDVMNHIGDLNKYSTKIDHFFPSLHFHFFIFLQKKLAYKLFAFFSALNLSVLYTENVVGIVDILNHLKKQEYNTKYSQVGSQTTS